MQTVKKWEWASDKQIVAHLGGTQKEEKFWTEELEADRYDLSTADAQQLVKEANAQLEAGGYSLRVADVRDADDELEWIIAAL